MHNESENSRKEQQNLAFDEAGWGNSFYKGVKKSASIKSHSIHRRANNVNILENARNMFLFVLNGAYVKDARLFVQEMCCTTR